MSSIKGTPPMTVTVEDTPGGFDVNVEHADHQSYSRAVDPRATKAAKAHMAARGLRNVTLVNVDYYHEAVAVRRGVSTFYYRID